jgi:hypothetical protein
MRSSSSNRRGGAYGATASPLSAGPGRVLSGYRHELQITSKRSSWPLVLVGAGLVAVAMGIGT